MSACAQWGAASQWSTISRRRREQWERPAYQPDYTVRRRDAGLSARAQKILGSNGVARFQEFRSYEEGWDFGGGGGVALTPRSIAAMERFLSAFDGFGAGEPSLFLNRDGHLILAWEDSTEERVEVEFGENNDATLYLPMYGDDGRTFDLTGEVAALIEAIPH